MPETSDFADRGNACLDEEATRLRPLRLAEQAWPKNSTRPEPSRRQAIPPPGSSRVLRHEDSIFSRRRHIGQFSRDQEVAGTYPFRCMAQQEVENSFSVSASGVFKAGAVKGLEGEFRRSGLRVYLVFPECDLQAVFSP